MGAGLAFGHLLQQLLRLDIDFQQAAFRSVRLLLQQVAAAQLHHRWVHLQQAVAAEIHTVAIPNAYLVAQQEARHPDAAGQLLAFSVYLVPLETYL